jgi:hypothetical protein
MDSQESMVEKEYIQEMKIQKAYDLRRSIPRRNKTQG